MAKTLSGLSAAGLKIKSKTYSPLPATLLSEHYLKDQSIGNDRSRVALCGVGQRRHKRKKTKPALRTENRGAYIIRFTIEGNKGTVSAENYMFHVKQRALKEKSGIVPNISCERLRGPRVDFVGVWQDLRQTWGSLARQRAATNAIAMSQRKGGVVKTPWIYIGAV